MAKTDEIDVILAREYGENVGRIRTAKWVLFLMTYKSEEDVQELLEKMIVLDSAADPRLAKLKRY